MKRASTNLLKSSNLNMMTASLKTAWRLNSKAMILTFADSLLSSLEPYVGILLSAYIIDGLTTGENSMKLIQAVILGIIIALSLRIILGMVNLSKDVNIDICIKRFDMEMCKKTLHMDYEQLDSSMNNELRSRIKNDNNWGAGFYSVFWHISWLLKKLFGFITAIIVIIPLFYNNRFFSGWLPAVFFLGLLVISLFSSFFVTLYSGKKVVKIMDEVAEKKSYSNYFMFQGIDYKQGKDIRIYNASAMIKNMIQMDFLWSRSFIRRFSLASGLGGMVSGAVSGLLQGGAYLLVVLQAAGGYLTIGSVLKYAMTIYNLADNFSNLLFAIGQFAVTARRQQSTLEYWNIPDSLVKGTLPVEKRSDNEYEIEFKNVSFRYPGSQQYALKNVSLKLRIGERLAVVGRNGSGKTTFIKLLCRLYDPAEGEILLNGINIQKYDYNEYLSIFSVVFQDFNLFSLSLGQNVATQVEYEEDLVQRYLIEAGFGERYSSLEKRAETYLYNNYEESGIEISGGEAQKIALARALYKNTPFIILDEPTAALDPIAEFEIYSKFNQIVGNKTAIFISHRLSSCRFCDDIVVFDGGQIIQRGSHNNLIENINGKYYQLWNAQAQYYT